MGGEILTFGRRAQAEEHQSRSAGGADAHAEGALTRRRMLNISGRSTMTKKELVDALEKESKRKTKQNS